MALDWLDKTYLDSQSKKVHKIEKELLPVSFGWLVAVAVRLRNVSLLSESIKHDLKSTNKHCSQTLGV